ncbi:MAG: acyl-CoA thioesterase [Deltaproteobacteria bacterium]|nr:acyl-CoA thioesterase [Deltaproteobacteria bacterium]
MHQPKKRSVTITSSELVFPEDLNHYGSLFGGRLLSWMDKAGYFASASFCGFPCVTASIESINFELSLKSGDVLEIKAKVIYSGKTSMVVEVKVYKLDIFKTHETILANTGYFTFVALNEKGNPQAVPQIFLETEDDKKLFIIGQSIKKTALSRKNNSNNPVVCTDE